jgi:hypothetical protein
MRTIAKFGLGLLITAGLSFGATNWYMYRGQLVDASCYNQSTSHTGKYWVTCAPTATTSNFAIHTNGRMRILDDAGNTKAAAALKEGDLKRDKNGDMPVVIHGHRTGNTINVEGIRARSSDTSVH